MSAPYTPRRPASSRLVPVRGLDYHLQQWGDPAGATPQQPLLVLAHGWMDVGASFQFAVDALRDADGFDRCVVAPDWRGFGLTQPPPTDSYWFPDYLGDLDALLDRLSPDLPVDLAGHSMGGNIVMGYAGVRPQRVRRLINMEGFGLPRSDPRQAPKRLAQWLDQLREAPSLRSYADLGEVAQRLQQTNARLTPDKASWLAPHWSSQRDDGRWHVLGDPVHKRINPLLYRADEVAATWAAIEAPVLWLEGSDDMLARMWQGRYPRSEFEARLAEVPRLTRCVLDDAGHMLHHDQPYRLSQKISEFLA